MQAHSENQKKEIYRLRYQVYVQEYGFERAEDHPGGLETDQYEPYSIHLAALDQTNEVVGTIRMILHSENGFPIEHAVETRFIGEKPPPERIAEISRLAVARKYRRRKEDGFAGVESYLSKSEGGILSDTSEIDTQPENRKRPAIVLGLCRLMYQESKRLGLTHWYMITEKKVWYALKRYGFIFHQIGDPIEYHGIRVPYLAIIEEVENYISSTNPDFFKMMMLGLEEKYLPKMGATGKAD